METRLKIHCHETTTTYTFGPSFFNKRLSITQKSHCATCSPAGVILYQVTVSCKGHYYTTIYPRRKQSSVQCDNVKRKQSFIGVIFLNGDISTNCPRGTVLTFLKSFFHNPPLADINLPFTKPLAYNSECALQYIAYM